MTTYFDTFLETPVISRIRRNHGLEHATIHVLSKEIPGVSMAGHSDVGGFWLIGNLSTEQVRKGVETALQRMQNGEHKLAVHPNCGTNFVTSGAFAGVAAAAVMLGARKLTERLARIPLAIAFATLALMLAQPFGFIVQERVTTSGVPGDLEIVEIVPSRRGNLKAHRIITRG
jgi:uncharacterized protein YqhQ